MLALFSEDVQLPKELELFESICRLRPTLPLAFVPLTEEEQVFSKAQDYLCFYMSHLASYHSKVVANP